MAECAPFQHFYTVNKHKRAEDINVSYEEALNIAPKKLREKIQHSVIPVL